MSTASGQKSSSTTGLPFARGDASPRSDREGPLSADDDRARIDRRVRKLFNLAETESFEAGAPSGAAPVGTAPCRWTLTVAVDRGCGWGLPQCTRAGCCRAC